MCFRYFRISINLWTVKQGQTNLEEIANNNKKYLKVSCLTFTLLCKVLITIAVPMCCWKGFICTTIKEVSVVLAYSSLQHYGQKNPGEIYWATALKAFPLIFSMKAFLKDKLCHKRLFGFMKHTDLVWGGRKKKHKAKQPLNLVSLWSYHSSLYFPCLYFQSSQIFKHFCFNTISFK